jgi:putative glutamine amidotransferase
MAADF